MSREYAENRIREALKMSGGNVTLARQQIIEWAYEDTQLLFALARPHLSGIVAYQVDRVASGRAELEKRKPEATKQEVEGENFGMDLLRAVAADDAAIFGQENHTLQGKRGGASKQHMDAIRQLAAHSKTPQKKNP
ncbi:MAG: hypothetical protein KDI13_04720 [Alphaproteobacteria bacterium]|nr:hypothetical protein [Alphaproteobacteria bacterium]